VARSALANFLQGKPEQLVFVPNATTGINAVLRSYPFQPGDAVLTTNQEYNACRNALDFVADRTGIEIIVADIPDLIPDPQVVIDAIITAIQPNVKLALLDHVVSQTGLVLPIDKIIKALTDRGIETLIDGAHAPGMLPLNLTTLGATYYTGNCHKWLCSPRGAAFLYVDPSRINDVHPTTISHGRNDSRTSRSRFHLEFDWTGTWDPTAYLSVPAAIDFMGSLLPGGWPELMNQNGKKAIAARQYLAQVLAIPLLCPDQMLGSMATLLLPNGCAATLIQHLWDTHKIEVAVFPFPQSSSQMLRLSAQVYNDAEEYEFLAQALNSHQF
jgi:isopenicillin-N epimerase